MTERGDGSNTGAGAGVDGVRATTRIQPPSRAPRLGPRQRTDPALTLAKLTDVMSPHCGIVTEMQRLEMRDRGLRDVYGYGANIETATLLGFRPLIDMRAKGEAEAWRYEAEGRNGHRFAYDRTRAFVRAIGEALERYACCTYDPTPFVSAPWNDVAKDALDPRTVQMPTAQEYKGMRAKGFAPFDPAAPMRWQWGWSLRDNRHVLVPAQLVYLMYNGIPGEPIMQTSTSTGWAIHHTFEEAIHTGLREIVERDSFFITWLNRLRVPRLDLSTVDDPAARRFSEELIRYGAELRVLDTTTDFGIPSFAALVVDRRAGKPAFVVTLGAHPDPVRGLRQCLEEALMIHTHVRNRSAEGFDIPERMEDIRLMSHHGEFYLDRKNLHHLDWLLHDDPPEPFENVPSLASGAGDIWEEIRTMTGRFARAGHDALFVDTTPPDLREAGWATVKTMVPGTVRHEYGYGVRFLDCPRILQAPVAMGHRAHPATVDELNPDAHPYA